MPFLNILIPIAVTIIQVYVRSSTSKHDDSILHIVKLLANYLSVKPNNDLSVFDANIINQKIIK